MPFTDGLAACSDDDRKAALSRILETAMRPAFGAATKKELELAILDALAMIGFVPRDPKIYDLVQRLRITKPRARAMIYERELRRQDRDGLDKLAIAALGHPLLQNQGNTIALEIENPYLADHLRDRLAKLGHASDGSFSSSLIRLSADAATALVASYIPESQREAVRAALVTAGVPDTSFKGAIKAVIKKAGSKLAGQVGEELLGDAAGWLTDMISGKAEKIVDSITPLFSGDPGTQVLGEPESQLTPQGSAQV